MNLTTRQEVESRLGRPLTTEEAARIDVTIRDVSAGLYSVAPRIPKTIPIPDVIIAIASYKVIAALSTGGVSGGGASTGDIASEGLGGYQVTYRNSSGSNEVSTGSLSLSKAELKALRPWTVAGIGVMQIDPVVAVAY